MRTYTHTHAHRTERAMFSCVARNNSTYHSICDISDLGTQHPIFSSWSPASSIPTTSSSSTFLCSSPLESLSLPILSPPPRPLPLPRPLACSLPLPLPCPFPLPFRLSLVCSGASLCRSMLWNLAFVQMCVREVLLPLRPLSLARARSLSRSLSLSTYVCACVRDGGWGKQAQKQRLRWRRSRARSPRSRARWPGRKLTAAHRGVP
jgi:hypothetical protein